MKIEIRYESQDKNDDPALIQAVENALNTLSGKEEKPIEGVRERDTELENRIIERLKPKLEEYNLQLNLKEKKKTAAKKSSPKKGTSKKSKEENLVPLPEIKIAEEPSKIVEISGKLKKFLIDIAEKGYYIAAKAFFDSVKEKTPQ